MIQEFEKLQNLLNVPPGYNDENRCGFNYNANDRFEDILIILNKTPLLKGVGHVNSFTYSTNNVTLETLFNNIETPILLYEFYECYHSPVYNYGDNDWLYEEQIYVWNHISGKKVLLIYDAYDCEVSHRSDYSVFLLTFDEIIEKINKITYDELKYMLDDDIHKKQYIINKKKQIIQNLYNKSNYTEEFEYWRGIRI
jgi:hypothetical protein